MTNTQAIETVSVKNVPFEVLRSENKVGPKNNAFRKLYVAKLNGSKVYEAVVHPGQAMRPNCRKTVSVQHLKDSEGCAKAVASLCGQYRLSKRTTPPKGGPGRPRKEKSE